MFRPYYFIQYRYQLLGFFFVRMLTELLERLAVLKHAERTLKFVLELHEINAGACGESYLDVIQR
jgi:hypothetical protein